MLLSLLPSLLPFLFVILIIHRWALRTLAQAFGTGYRRPERRDASRQHPPRWRWAGGENQDGSPALRREDLSRGRAGPAMGGRGSSGKSSEVIGSLQRSAPASGDAIRRRGEARPLRPSEYPVGTGKRSRMRGGLVVMSPEVICGEAPKGQPLLRIENLVTDSGDDPQGHPMIHGCRRPHKPRPSGNPKE